MQKIPDEFMKDAPSGEKPDFSKGTGDTPPWQQGGGWIVSRTRCSMGADEWQSWEYCEIGLKEL